MGAGGRITVMHLITRLATGGAERLLMAGLACADQENLDVHVVGLCPPHKTVDEFRRAGISVETLTPTSVYSRRIIARVEDVIRRIRPHVLHTHLPVADVIGALAARRAGVPVVVSTIHSIGCHYFSARRLRRWLYRWALRRWPRPLIAVGQQVARDLERALGPHYPIHVIPNCVGFPLQRYQIPRERARELLGIPEGVNVITTVGRLVRQKRHRLVLDALKLLERRDDWLALIVGDGPLRRELEEHAEHLGLLGKKVKFLGFRDDVPEILRATDIYVHVSTFEGLPLAVVEAAMAGAAIIATPAGGIPEVISDGETGVIWQGEGPESLAETIERLIIDRELSRALGAAARESVLDRFTARAWLRAHRRLYLQLLSQEGYSLA